MLFEWLITLNCNYSCPYCYLPNQREIITCERDPKEILTAIERKGGYQLDITGGEPFLVTDALTKAIDFCLNHNLKIRSISTNGSIFNRKVIEMLKKVNDFILHISLDAATQSTYRVMRNSTNFRQVITNAQRFIENGLNVFLGITLTKKNYKELPILIKLAERIGAKGISLGGFIPIGRGSQLTSWCLNKKEMEEVFSVCKNANKEIEIIGLGDNSCPAGIDKWCVLPNGDLYPCALLVNFKEAKVGNLFQKEKLPSLNEWLQKFLEFQPPLECQNCHLPSLCYGGCKAVLYAKYHSFPENLIPFCALSKSGLY